MANPTEELLRRIECIKRNNDEQLRLFNKVAEQRDNLYDVLKEAQLQIEYLNNKYKPTATTATILMRINNALKQVEDSKNVQ